MTFSVHASSGSWAAARAGCDGLGSQLAKIISASEMSSVVSLLDASSLANEFRVWIGASDSMVEGDFRWVDGTSITYTDWGIAQPVDKGNEDCIALKNFAGEWKWEDTGCDFTAAGYVCSPPSPPHPPTSPLPPAPPPSAPLAPPMSLTPGGTTHYVISFALSNPDPGPLKWTNARSYCAGLGMQLAVVRTAADQAALEAALAPLDPKGHAMMWIGLQNSGGAYTWSDGSAVGSYSNWRSTFPKGNDPCIEMYGPEFTWSNAWCDGPRAFACSSLPPPPAPPAPPPSPSPPPLPPAPLVPPPQSPPLSPSSPPMPSPPPAASSSPTGSSPASSVAPPFSGAPLGNEQTEQELSTRTIAGIVIGVAGSILLVSIALITYFLCKRSSSSPRRPPAPTVPDANGAPKGPAPAAPVPFIAILNPGPEPTAGDGGLQVEMITLAHPDTSLSKPGGAEPPPSNPPSAPASSAPVGETWRDAPHCC